MSVELGRLVRAAMRDKGLSQGKVAVLVGVFDSDRYLDATQVRLIATGERKPTRGLVERLIDVLDLDPAEAWPAAGLWPPDLEASEYRRLRERPLVPSLTRVGGSDTPTAPSLRPVRRASSQQGDSTTGTRTTTAGQRRRHLTLLPFPARRGRRHETGQVAA